MTTAAAIDRLIHHCVVLELNLRSYRLEEAQSQGRGEKGQP
jgi:DNA replication protein DnaC